MKVPDPHEEARRQAAREAEEKVQAADKERERLAAKERERNRNRVITEELM